MGHMDHYSNTDSLLPFTIDCVYSLSLPLSQASRTSQTGLFMADPHLSQYGCTIYHNTNIVF